MSGSSSTTRSFCPVFAIAYLNRWRQLLHVPNAFSFDHKNDHLRDIGRVIGHALEIFRYRADLHGAVDRVRILDHEGDDFAEDLAVELVDLFVVLANFQRQASVLAHKSVQAFAGHSLRDARHARDVDIRFELRLLIEFQSALTGVDRHVANTLEVGSDLEPGGDKAQVFSRRLMEREQPDAQLIDFDVPPVPLMIALHPPA